MPPRRFLPVALAVAAALVVASAAAARTTDATAYRAKVNGICRTFTPKLKQVETDMAKAKTAGDVHRYAYDLGVVLGLALRQGLLVEGTALPVDADAQLRSALKLLHVVDIQTRRALEVAAAGDSTGFARGLTRLLQTAKPLNERFDAAGLADCGSHQA